MVIVILLIKKAVNNLGTNNLVKKIITRKLLCRF